MWVCEGKRNAEKLGGSVGDREREYVGVWVCGGGMRNAEKLKVRDKLGQVGDREREGEIDRRLGTGKENSGRMSEVRSHAVARTASQIRSFASSQPSALESLGTGKESVWGKRGFKVQ